MTDHDDQTTVGATDDLLAEVQTWVAQQKAPAEPWRPPVFEAPEVSTRPPVEDATRPRDQRPPPSPDDVWRASDDVSWRPPGRLAGSADAPVPTPVDTRPSTLGLTAAIGLVGALIGGAVVWVVASRDSGPAVADEPATEIRRADDDSQLGG